MVILVETIRISVMVSIVCLFFQQGYTETVWQKSSMSEYTVFEMQEE